MVKTSVFEFDDYKRVLSRLLLGVGNRGNVSRAAEFMQCQTSYLSRVIASEVQLTPDQAFLFGKFMKWPTQDAEFFQTLVEIHRASQSVYRDSLLTKIAHLRKEHESIQKIVGKQSFAVAEKESIYFSSWHWSAIHFLTSIPSFQTPSAIAQRLSLPEKMVVESLKYLENLELIRQRKGRWEYSNGEFHLPKTSPYVRLHHQNWRARAAIESHDTSGDGIHYTSVLTLSKTDHKRLRQLLMNFITESNALAQPSLPEECVVLTCDLFRV